MIELGRDEFVVSGWVISNKQMAITNWGNMWFMYYYDDVWSRTGPVRSHEQMYPDLYQ